ncbi:MAG: hypothetical protein JAY74_18725 [Candidatus Thiodiazotropha taylori]|nr:hypothetical protein [Candidatus Thiodiazotropha taylori]
MNTKVNAPALAGTQGAIESSQPHDSKIRKGTKLHSVISHLVNGHRLHRFQAETVCRDHVLPSTIAGFQRIFSIPVNREYVTVPGYGGSRVRVAEYWLDSESREAAQKLLEVT